jgi:Cu/Ag efflux protein CusF
VNASLTRCGVVGLAVWLVVSGGAAVEGLQAASDATSKPDYQGTGVVVGLHPPPSSLHATRPVVVLHHDPIVGLMDETMSMPFIATSTKLFKGLKPGDRVEFGLKSTEDALLVISLRRATSTPPR